MGNPISAKPRHLSGQFKTNFSILMRRFGRIFFFAIIGLILVWVLNTVFTRFFKLQEIKVIGDNVNIEVNPSKLENNLFFIDTLSLEKELKLNYPQIKTIRISKQFPSNLIIFVVLKRPVAVLKTDRRSVLIDPDGIIVGTKPSENSKLPNFLFDLPDVPDGTKLSDNTVQTALRLVSRLPDDLRSGNITIIEKAWLQLEIGKTSIFIDPNQPIDPAVTTLQTLLARFRMKGAMPTSIDLRFDKPVVIF
jgi:cell division septal protein FtsQ